MRIRLIAIARVAITVARTICSKNTDWRSYTLRMIDLLGQLGNAHYIKRDLQRYLRPGYHNPLRIPQHH
jgi:hypothetical protein